MASPSLGGGRVTRERYWKLVEDGVIGPDDRVELLDGVIVAMSPRNPPHALVIGALTKWLGTVVGAEAFVRVQLPLDLSELSTPEPDLAVVAGSPRDFAVSHPTTALLVVEVADSSVIQDRLTKMPIYAAAGIPEYWLVDLRDRCIELYRTPITGERRYAATRIVRPGDAIDVLAVPGSSLAVDEILPPV
jgi:Uma2 family endonuclease